jgi:hypothetical protein
MAFGIFAPYPLPMSTVPYLVRVFRVSPVGKLQLMPNLVCIDVQKGYGPDPTGARFRYQFDDALPIFPSDFSHVMTPARAGPFVVAQDDRLRVIVFTHQGIARTLFDGFAQIAQLDLDPDRQNFSFEAVGAEARSFDRVMSGSKQRHATPELVDRPNWDVDTDIPCRFNPEGRGNATLKDKDSYKDSMDGMGYPVFLDQEFFVAGDPVLEIDDKAPRKWTLAMFAKYVLGVMNPDQRYWKRPSSKSLDLTLIKNDPNQVASQDGEKDDDEKHDIVIADYDATGKPLPIVLDDILTPHGFSFRWVLSDAGDALTGSPQTRLVIDDTKRGTGRIKRLSLQELGATLDPGRSNLWAASLVGDGRSVVNAYVLESGLNLYEVSFILLPAFAPSAPDAQGQNKKKFLTTSPDFHKDANDTKYRRYLFGEVNDQVWHPKDRKLFTPWPKNDSLDSVFGEKVKYAYRKRKPRDKLLTLNRDGEPRRSTLSVSKDYKGKAPGIWDGTGTWQSIAEGWKLLEDQIGILVTATDPSEWHIGKNRTRGMPFPGGNINILRSWTVESSENPGPYFPGPFYLRLTTVIEGDKGMGVRAGRLPMSGAKFEIERSIDSSDVYQYNQVMKGSEFAVDAKENKEVRDDRVAGLSYAESHRESTQLTKYSGSITIPRLTNAYEVGDRIECIDGRNVDFRMDRGGIAGAGEMPVYPMIVKISYSLDGGQRTTLHLTDRRTEQYR